MKKKSEEKKLYEELRREVKEVYRQFKSYGKMITEFTALLNGIKLEAARINHARKRLVLLAERFDMCKDENEVKLLDKEITSAAENFFKKTHETQFLKKLKKTIEEEFIANLPIEEKLVKEVKKCDEVLKKIKVLEKEAKKREKQKTKSKGVKHEQEKKKQTKANSIE